MPQRQKEDDQQITRRGTARGNLTRPSILSKLSLLYEHDVSAAFQLHVH